MRIDFHPVTTIQWPWLSGNTSSLSLEADLKESPNGIMRFFYKATVFLIRRPSRSVLRR